MFEATSQVLPLSTIQKDYLLNPHLADDQFSSIGFSVDLKGEVDSEIWRKALWLVARNSIAFRTRIEKRSTELHELGIQVVGLDPNYHFDFFDLSDQNISETQIATLIAEKQNENFKVNGEHLARFTLLKISENNFKYVAVAHHILVDAAALNAHFLQTYRTYIQLSKGELSPKFDDNYGDFIAESEQIYDLPDAIDFWREQLSGGIETPKSSLNEWSGVKSYIVKNRVLSSELWKRIRSVSKRNGITPAVFFKSAYGVVLNEYCNPVDDFFAVEAFHGRPAKFKEAIGFFSSQIPIVYKKKWFEGNNSVSNLMLKLKEQQRARRSYQFISAKQVYKEISKNEPVFVFNYFDVYVPEDVVEIISNPVAVNKVVGYVQFCIRSVAQTCEISISYHNSDFHEEELLDHIVNVLEQMVGPKHYLGDIKITRAVPAFRTLQESKKDSMLNFIDELELVRKANKNNVALQFENASLNYEDLQFYIDRISRALKAFNIGPEKCVALHLGRSIEHFVCLLAVWQTGAAVVPIDPNLPVVRKEEMINDSKCHLVIARDNNDARFNESVVVSFEYLMQANVLAPNFDTSKNTSLKNVSYVIFTSGSTGKPKGAANTFSGLANLVQNLREKFQLDPVDNVLAFASPSFDASIWEALMAFGSGATLTIASEEQTHDPQKLSALIQNKKVSCATLPPTMLEQLSPENLNLRLVVSAGEKCTAKIMKEWLPYSKFMNAYGPSETAVCATWHATEHDDLAENIGQPINNVAVYILNDNLQPVPTGIVGELYVSGENLGRGYINDAAKTASSFLPNPFSSTPGERMYRTGDLVRINENNHIFYVGRTNRQIKLRGYRIELTEIEKRLEQLDVVDHAYVRTYKANHHAEILVAYCLISPNQAFDRLALREQLEEVLPKYMVPSCFIRLEKFPVNQNGKIDTKQLREPIDEDFGKREYVAPRNEIEELLVKISEGLLGMTRIGVYDDFHDLGGNSITATRLSVAIEEEFGVQISISDIYNFPTIEKLSVIILNKLLVLQEQVDIEMDFSEAM